MRRLLHHQKPPAPSSATMITPTIAILIIQRIASLAIRKKMISKTTPAIMKMVVKLISVGGQWSVVSLTNLVVVLSHDMLYLSAFR